MASAQYYINQMLSQTGIKNNNLQELIAALGGTASPVQDQYNQMQMMNVTTPELRTIAQYLSELGAEGYTLNAEDFLKAYNDASRAGLEATINGINDAEATQQRTQFSNYETAADTIRNLNAQAIQSGVMKGMQNANLLSTILGISQQNAQAAQDISNQRYQAGKDYAAELLKNAVNATNASNSAYETLMGNIRQLYNDDIQRETAELEYNASAGETNANYLANKYASDTNYANAINNSAANIYSALQSALSQIASAGASAEAQDNYSAAVAAQKAAAAAAAAAAADNTSSYTPSTTTPTTYTTGTNNAVDLYGKANYTTTPKVTQAEKKAAQKTSGGTSTAKSGSSGTSTLNVKKTNTTQKY